MAFITCITACCCCKCCEKTKEKIRRLDPRNAMREAGMGQGAQMAALGAVAAGEYMENRNDKQDEARVAAMQGQSMGMPGGAPPGNYLISLSRKMINRIASNTPPNKYILHFTHLQSTPLPLKTLHSTIYPSTL